MSIEDLAVVITGIITVYFIAATFSDLHGYEKLKEDADKSREQYYFMLEKRNSELRKENEHLRRECIVLHHGQKQEAEDGKKERNEKV